MAKNLNIGDRVRLYLPSTSSDGTVVELCPKRLVMVRFSSSNGGTYLNHESTLIRLRPKKPKPRVKGEKTWEMFIFPEGRLSDFPFPITPGTAKITVAEVVT